MKYNKGFAPVLVLIIVLGVLAVGGVAYFAGKSSAPKNEVSDNSNYFPPVQQNQNSPVTSNTNNNITPPVNTQTNASITLLSPNGGEILKAGGTYKIKWQTSSSFSSDYPKVSITLVGGSRDQAVTPDQNIITNNTGSYEWTIPNAQLSTYIQDVSGGSYALKNISGQNLFKFLITGYPPKSMRAEGPLDYSNNYFTITTPSVSTSNWKTYSGVDFSLKYPATWYLNTSGSGPLTITNYDSSMVPGSDASVNKENIVISIYKYTNLSANETVESWVNKIGLSDKRNILVDGIKAIRGKIIYTGQEESGYYQKGESSGDDVRVIYNGKGYQIGYSPYGSKLISTFDQILSTFKFTR